MSNSRKHIKPETKVLILREHLENKVSIADLAEKYHVHPNLIGRWKKELFEGAVGTFARKQGKDDNRAERKLRELESKLQKRDTLIAHIVAENIDLKKNEPGVS